MVECILLLLAHYLFSQKFNDPFNSNKVYFSMEIQVKLYRRVMYVFRKLLSGGFLVRMLTIFFNRIDNNTFSAVFNNT